MTVIEVDSMLDLFVNEFKTREDDGDFRIAE
jgi:hypothetical protein